LILIEDPSAAPLDPPYQTECKQAIMNGPVPLLDTDIPFFSGNDDSDNNPSNNEIELPVMKKSFSNRDLAKKDPVFWFGMLIAASLRDPQIQFKKCMFCHVLSLLPPSHLTSAIHIALLESCNLASSKHRLVSLTSEYDRLKQIKRK
jgi:hypothetical protein